MRATYNGGSREAILPAALRVISRLGYAEASVATIARQAHVNGVTIFRVFESKENLFREVVKRYSEIDFDTEKADALLKRGAPVEANLMALTATYFETVFSHIDIMRIFIVEAQHFDFVRRAAWYIPPALARHCARFLSQSAGSRAAHDGATERRAEMIVAHAVRRALEYNKHDNIWEFSGELAADFRKKAEAEVRFLARFVAWAGATARNGEGRQS